MIKRRSTLAVSFYIHRGKFKKGKHPIIMRITIDTTTAMLYTKQHIFSEHWNVDKRRVMPEDENAPMINAELDRFENLVLHHHKRVISERGIITADMVKQAILKGADPTTLLGIFRMHNERYKRHAGKDNTLQTLECYEVIYGSIEKFIKLRYDVEDVILKRLDIDFINDYEFHLRITKRLSPCTVLQRIMLLRKVVRLAMAKGLLTRDPFFGYTSERVKRNTDFMTEEELHKILSLNIEDIKLCFARDLFVFSAFTGLSYCDIRSLKNHHISCSSEGEVWIIKKRENTDMESKIILFDIPLKIIQKYKTRRNGNKIFDAPNRTIISRQMKSISRIYGFDRNILFRMARPCFAGLITLKHGIPVETVSRMMGYSSAEAISRFINISKQKVGDDMDLLIEKMDGLYKLQKFLPYDRQNRNSYFMQNAKCGKITKLEQVLSR